MENDRMEHDEHRHLRKRQIVTIDNNAVMRLNYHTENKIRAAFGRPSWTRQSQT